MLKNAEHCRRLRLPIFHPTPPPRPQVSCFMPSLAFTDRIPHPLDPLSKHATASSLAYQTHVSALWRQQPYVLWGFCPPHPHRADDQQRKGCRYRCHRCVSATWKGHVASESERQGRGFHMTPVWFSETLWGKKPPPQIKKPPPAHSWLLNSQLDEEGPLAWFTAVLRAGFLKSSLFSTWPRQWGHECGSWLHYRHLT